MKRASIPALVPVPFAASGTKNTIPVDSQIGITDGAASFTDGFPPLTMTPVAAGGIPPSGGDFNGILNAITLSIQWACAGGQYSYNSSFSTAVGGYPKGAMLQNSSGDVTWLNINDDNKNDPATGTGWVPVVRYGKTTVALAAANVTLTAEQAAKETIVLSGALTENVSLIMPAWVETWLIINNTTGNFTVSVKTSAGSGVNLSAGTTNQIYGDGTNIYYGSLMARNNLAEIKAAGTNSQAAARTNLGLGTAATANVTTSATDTTAGRILKVGDYGMGATAGVTNLASIFDINCGATYSALGAGAGASATVGMPNNSGNTRFGVYAYSIYSNQYWVSLVSTAQVYTGLVNTSTKTVSWTQHYTDTYKPTAKDVNALPLSTNTLSVNLNTLGATSSAGVYYQTTSANATAANGYPIQEAGTLVVTPSAYGSQQEYTAFGSARKFVRGLSGNWNGSNGPWYAWTEILNTSTGDSRYQPKGSYYTTTESDARFQKINTASKAANGWFKDSNTGMIIQWGSGTTVNTNVAFPVSFPSVCTSVQVTDAGNGKAVFAATRSNSGMTIYTSGSNPVYSWIAIGY